MCLVWTYEWASRISVNIWKKKSFLRRLKKKIFPSVMILVSTGKQMVEWMIRQRKNEKDKGRREKEWMNERKRKNEKRIHWKNEWKRKLLKLFIRPLSWCPLLSLHYYSTKPSSFLPSFLFSFCAVKPKLKEKERI